MATPLTLHCMMAPCRTPVVYDAMGVGMRKEIKMGLYPTSARSERGKHLMGEKSNIINPPDQQLGTQ